MKTNIKAAPNNNSQKFTDVFVIIISVVLAIFHLYSASIGVMPSYAQSAIHWGLVGSYIIFTRPLKFKGGIFIDAILLITNLFISYYQIILQEKFIKTAGVYADYEIIIAVVSIIVIIEIARRTIGKVLPIIALLFITYALFGNNLSGMFKTIDFSIQRIAPYLYTSSDGLFGQTIYVSAQFIFLFVLFGAVLDMTGAGQFFVDIAFALTGKARGGPAQASIYSSMLMGSINGSGAANVVTTGTFTIPLMKKVGFKAPFAGAVEAVASNGGQITPPVMGAVAFLMAEMTGIDYGKIVLAAIPAAILYYVTLSVSVYVEAHKQQIPIIPQEERLKPGQVIRKGWIYLLPLIVLMGMLIAGYSAQKSGFFAIVVSLIIGFIKKRENMNPRRLVQALKEAASGIAPIASACILAGIVMGVLNLTGLGLKISGIIVQMAHGQLIIALILAMITSLVLGMGLPTSAAYMVLAILVAPALIKMGVTQMGAHLFILYFGALSTITPPVALSTFAAAGIAGSGMWETGLNAMKLAIAGFIIPFVFAVSPAFLLMGKVSTVIYTIITALIGCIMLAIGMGGWFKARLSVINRILLILSSIFLIVPRPFILNIIGGLASIVILTVQFRKYKNQI